MTTRMLIDARHPEETRVAVVKGNRIEDFDFEAADRKQLKGNIYLAKVTRVEPSLQAAFVDYGGNRHGFLAFSEIHPDYYQVPLQDREALLREEQSLHDHDDDFHADEEEGEDAVTQVGETDDFTAEHMRKKRMDMRRRYKIQEVIKRRQIMLVQVVKEERGGKGAALTTYLSLAGRYCVLMPNTTNGGGISRKISSVTDRRRLKTIMSDLKLPGGMACIIRTAGLKRTKSEIKRDFDYLTRLWDDIRDLTLKSTAPSMIYEDSSLIKRAIRDIYSREIDEIMVEGDQGYRAAKDFMRLLMPSHARKVQQYRDPMPLFAKAHVEAQLESMYSPIVQLKSGGYIVINPTEALISIDINSGRATREHNIEETALKTNLEAAQEIARQLRLRDLAGLVVIDFIDMEDRNNVRAVERRLKEALKSDRARIQVGRISSFGLMEMSRQRLRTGVLEASTEVCPHCEGAGFIRTISSAALHVLRGLEDEAASGKASILTVRVASDVAIYLLNHKRGELTMIEQSYGVSITIEPATGLLMPRYEIDRAGPPPVAMPMQPLLPVVEDEDDLVEEEEEDEDEDFDEADEEEAVEEERPARAAAASEDRSDRSRNRRRRRRRRRGGEDAPALTRDEQDETTELDAADIEAADAQAEAEERGERRRRRRRRRSSRRDRSELPATAQEATAEAASAATGAPDGEPVETSAEPAATEAQEAAPTDAEQPAEEKPKRRRAAPRRKKATEAEPASAEAAVDAAPEPAAPEPATSEPAAPEAEAPPSEEPPAKPKRRAAPRRKTAKATDASAEIAADAPAEAAPAEAAPAEVALAVASPRDAETVVEAAPESIETVLEAEEPASPPPPPRKGWWQRTFGA